MNLAQLFNPVEKIIGIEIARGRICAVMLEKNKKGVVTGTKKEIAVPAGILAPTGAVLDKQKLASVLKALWQSGKDAFRSSYVIVVLPSGPTFTDIITFPKVSSEQLKEAVALHVNTKTLFPVEQNDIYYDWQPIAAHTGYHEDVLLSFGQRSYIHDFAEACELAGLKPLAFETPPLAMTRAVTNCKDTAGLIVRITEEIVETVVVANNTLFFTHKVQLPSTYSFETLKTTVKIEATHALNYYATEFAAEPPITLAIVIASMPKKQELSNFLGTELNISIEEARYTHTIAIGDACISAFGAALRGLIPREDDALISLLPIGTEEAYKKRRLLTYVSLWGDIINATAIFFVILFGVTLFFLNIAEKNAGEQSTRLKATAASNEQLTVLGKEVAHFNSIVSAVAQANDSIILFSPIIEKVLPSFRHDGIIIKAMILSPSGADVRISVIAATRINAISFRKSLESNPLFTKAIVPSLSATQRINIPLDITVSLAQQTP